MNYSIDGDITKVTEREILEIYNWEGKLDYLLINSSGGDFIATHNIVCKILAHQPYLPVIIEEKAFSAAAYLFLCLRNRYFFQGSSLYVHSIKVNIYAKDINLLLCKRKYYSKLLRERIAAEFNIDTHTANMWLRKGKAFPDSDLVYHLDSIPINNVKEIKKDEYFRSI